MISNKRASILAGVAIVALGTPAAAKPQTDAHYDLPAQGLATTLRAIGKTGHVETLFEPDDVAGVMAPPIQGDLTVAQAVDRALAVTDLIASYANGTVIIGRRSSASRGNLDEAGAGADIVVTGSRIRGAPVASPVITLTAEGIRNAGQTTLGDVVRSIPQSFGGGQNPGVASNVPSSSGSNIGGGSSINLRGLGSDATLTLLNGHRLTYTGARQGVDVSSIPLGAVDRIEIVADGASALYGSDAVAGVANIRLKRDYDALEVSARYGAATQGAYAEQQYGAVSGTRWSSGGLLAAYEYGSNTPIISTDRSFTRGNPGVTIYQGQRHHSALLTGHQSLGDALTFQIDALYNKRWIARRYPQNAAGDLDISRGEQSAVTQSWAVAPSLTLGVGDAWQLGVNGTYGRDEAATETRLFTGPAEIARAFVCYCNAGKAVEATADGPLFALPGGQAKIAMGTGYRYNLLDAFRSAGNVQNIRQSQSSYYAYGEVSLPLISAVQDLAFVHSLNLSGALRYERYPGIDSVVTPKLGLIFAPSPDLDLKGSWGKSFRAPTLLQQYQARSVSIYPAAILGARNLPATATALLLGGGNPAVKPERATTWTATLDLHPRALPGARLQLTYFSTRYTDRIVTPITFLSQSLSNASYAPFRSANPSAAEQAAIIASAPLFGNFSGSGYIPANVVALVDNSNVNAGRQTIRGADILADYRTDLGANAGLLALQLNASYLKSDQLLFAGQPVQQLAGLLFNPPHWRARGGITWDRGPLTANATASYIGSVEDVEATPVANTDAMTTLDLSLRYKPVASGILDGIEVDLSVRNLFDDKPSRIASYGFADTTYDSTNYSPIGRFVSLGVTKKW